MLRSFFVLTGLIILPVILLIYIEPFNPIHFYRKHLVKNYFTQTYQGSFRLIENYLKEYSEEEWEERFKKIAPYFGYELKLIHLSNLKKDYKLTSIKNNNLIYLDKEPSELLKRIDDSSWIISMKLDETEDEETINSTNGTIYLIKEYFKKYPQSQWGVALKDLQSLFGEIRLQLVKIDDLNLNQKKIAEINHKDFTWVDNDNETEIYFTKLFDSSYVLTAHVDTAKNLNTKLIIYVVFILILAISIGLLSWLFPLWNDLKKLDQKSTDFGNGVLDSRVAIRKRSIASRLAKSFNSMAQSIQKLISGNQELTNAIAHDLRTPLARLRFVFEVLDSEKYSEEEKKEYLKRGQKSIDSLDYLINQILTYSRYSRVSNIQYFSETNFHKIIIDEIDFYQNEFKQFHFKLSVTPSLVNSKRLIDKKAMNRALSNLINNATRFAKKVIQISYIQKDSNLVLIVEDDGMGIDSSHYESVLNPFSQVHNPERNENIGHGLGLAIVSQIAKWHNGGIKIDRSLLGGAYLEIFWPIKLK